MPRRHSDPAYARHDETALEAAREGMVLLKNDNHVLPLAADAAISCFGSAQYMFRNTSTGAGLINPRWQANFHQALAEHSRFAVNEAISGLYQRLQDVTPTEEQLKAAVQKGDTALILISRCSGEFLDNKPVKGGYYLTDEERSMIAAVARAFPKTVAILNTGYPIEMGWIAEYGINAVIYTGFAGQGAGYALMEILDGRTNPSGKLPDTWAYDYYDYPSAQNFINFSAEDTVPREVDKGVLLYYEEDIYVGYRYFDTFGKSAAYSFGHGLSYTDFSVKAVSCDFDGEAVTVQVRVSNCGKVRGKEVVQLYIQAPEDRLEKPRRVLAAFEKTSALEPGGEQTVTLRADGNVFSSFDEESGCYLLEKGRYTVCCGNSLENAVEIGTFKLAKTKILRQVEHINAPVEDFHRLTKKDPIVQPDSRLVDMDLRIPAAAPRPVYAPVPM